MRSHPKNRQLVKPDVDPRGKSSYVLFHFLIKFPMQDPLVWVSDCDVWYLVTNNGAISRPPPPWSLLTPMIDLPHLETLYHLCLCPRHHAANTHQHQALLTPAVTNPAPCCQQSNRFSQLGQFLGSVDRVPIIYHLISVVIIYISTHIKRASQKQGYVYVNCPMRGGKVISSFVINVLWC